MSSSLLQRTLARWRGLAAAADGYDVSRLPAAQRSRFYAYYDAARARLEGATELGESGKPLPALLLYRDGFSMLAQTHQAATEPESQTAAGDGTSALEQFVEAISSRYEQTGRVLRDNLVAMSSERIFPDTLSPHEVSARVAEISAVTPDVLALMAPVRPEQRKMRRLVRYGAIASVLVASLVAIVAAVVRPENIALHKKATSMTTAFNTKPSGAVNGRIYEQFGFHSDNESSPALVIDLGKRFDISRVRVFGRHDCCFDQSIPMAVELSDDGEAYKTLAERHEAFDQLDSWDITADHPAHGRFLRVRTLKKGLLVLTEVEAYGTPSR